MTTVLDTSVLVDVLRGDRAAYTFLSGLVSRPTCSEISRAEVLRGVRSAERSITERLFSVLSWRPVDEHVSRLAGELGRQYRRSHTGLATADLVVAATALHLGTSVATANVRHFPMFKGSARRI